MTLVPKNIAIPNRSDIYGRQSNMEALRIVAMSMILIHHFMVHGLTPNNIPHNLYYAINSFVYSGVNIFFLLSGYFTIRYSSKGLIKFVLTILFFGVFNLILLYVVGAPPSIKEWLTVMLFPVSKSPYWFIKVYLILYVTAPILNVGLKNLKHNTLRNTLLMLLFVVFYGFHKLASSTYLHGMYLYCVGFYIGQYKPFENIRPIFFLYCFFIFSALSGGCDWAMHYIGFNKHYFHSYSNILIFFTGVSLLLYFRSLKLQSNAINILASASLGCYLLQDGFLGQYWLYPLQMDFLYSHGYNFKLILMFTTSFIAIWITSMALTKFSNMWIKSTTDVIAQRLKKLTSTIAPKTEFCHKNHN